MGALYIILSHILQAEQRALLNFLKTDFYVRCKRKWNSRPITDLLCQHQLLSKAKQIS